MAIGYAAFSAELKISGTSKVTSNWDIEITNVTSGTPTGGAENTVAPKWDKLTASMEADLYEKGDAMEYDVTIENKGTIDAKLNDVLTNIENANSEAVNITFSGYTKGEILKAKAIKVIHVKIEYNPNYEGEETSSEVEINFDYTQENKDSEAPKSYLLTYDYSSNGGTNVDIKEEYVTSKTKVNLNNNAYKEGYTFVGWNIDKDAKKGLTEYEMPESNTTLYAIYSKEIKITYTVGSNITNIGKTNDTCSMYNNETSCEVTLPNITPNSGYMIDGWYNGNSKIGNPNDKYKVNNNITLSSKVVEDIVSLSISTTMTTNSIRVVANASATSGINKYEYSKDGGKTWIVGTGNTHTFTGLTQGTSYNIMARITSNTGKGTTANKQTTTSTISKPTFSESGTSPKTVTINYPSGCGSTLTCTYQKDNGSAVTVKSTTANVEFTQSGSVVAKVTDGTNTVSSSYNVIVEERYYLYYNDWNNMQRAWTGTSSGIGKVSNLSYSPSTMYYNVTRNNNTYTYRNDWNDMERTTSSIPNFSFCDYYEVYATNNNGKYTLYYKSSKNDVPRLWTGTSSGVGTVYKVGCTGSRLVYAVNLNGNYYLYYNDWNDMQRAWTGTSSGIGTVYEVVYNNSRLVYAVQR